MELREAAYDSLGSDVICAFTDAAEAQGDGQRLRSDIDLARRGAAWLCFLVFGFPGRPPALALFCTPAAFGKKREWARVIAAVTLDRVAMSLKECTRFARELAAYFKGFDGTRIDNEAGLMAYWPFLLELPGVLRVPTPRPDEPTRCIALTPWRGARRSRTPAHPDDTAFDCLLRLRFDGYWGNQMPTAPGRDEVVPLGSNRFVLLARRSCMLRRLRDGDGDFDVAFDGPIVLVACCGGGGDVGFDFAVPLSDRAGDVTRFGYPRFLLNKLDVNGGLTFPVKRDHGYHGYWQNRNTSLKDSSVSMLCFSGFHLRPGADYGRTADGMVDFRDYLLSVGAKRADAARTNAARAIQRAWRRAACDPYRPVGRRALERRFFEVV